MRRAMLAALCVAAACGRGNRAAVGEPSSSPPPARSNEPFVVFARDEVVIDRLGVPVPAPVTVGSQPSPSTMASDTPDVVAVTADGSLVAARAGAATVRSVGGGVLRVEVRPANGLALEPGRIRLAPGAEARVRLVDAATRAEVPPSAAEWLTASPRVAVADAGLVRAGRRSGTTKILVRYGGQSVYADVVVERTHGKDTLRVAGSH